jgi:hypothetical protein
MAAWTCYRLLSCVDLFIKEGGLTHGFNAWVFGAEALRDAGTSVRAR